MSRLFQPPVEPKAKAAPFVYNDETPPPIVWDESMKPNPGFRPEEVRGKRIIVQLVNGAICGTESVTTVSPIGWAADGPQRCFWGRREPMPDGSPYPFDIARYKIVGPKQEEKEDAGDEEPDREA